MRVQCVVRRLTPNTWNLSSDFHRNFIPQRNDSMHEVPQHRRGNLANLFRHRICTIQIGELMVHEWDKNFCPWHVDVQRLTVVQPFSQETRIVEILFGSPNCASNSGEETVHFQYSVILEKTFSFHCPKWRVHLKEKWRTIGFNGDIITSRITAMDLTNLIRLYLSHTTRRHCKPPTTIPNPDPNSGIPVATGKGWPRGYS